MRHTGLFDKKDREILEGDMIRGEFSGHGGVWAEEGIVIWKSKKSKFLITLSNGGRVDFSYPKFRKKEFRKIIFRLDKDHAGIGVHLPEEHCEIV